MDGRSGMRAADADREVTAERLRVALEEGRLNLHEYDERLARAYGAKTYADLDEVVADLPGPAPAQRAAVAPAPPPPPPVAGNGGPVAGTARGRLLGLWTPWLRVAGILVPIWLLVSIGSRDMANFWPAWVLGPWGALLVMQSVGLLGGGHPRHPGPRPRRDRRRRR
ncbi:hypothetical protein GCM10010169_30210 [Micromonospora fulviviridis]|uniref:DUF1707 SHOCT-like domain-containing protein n=1 Tax=Micromonospora fulviviridis TaxID=47860 RepID=UPI0019B4A87C|nr:DUF1707 domain-containing protein [Micromonospora fulviviridis]GGR83920.1 hypothetical protein GCM10010169_30210 [Micromonospora fulviviridis]